MKKTQKLTEAALRAKVYDMVKEKLNEFRDGGAGDTFYVRPNGYNNLDTKLDWMTPYKGWGKRTTSNKQYTDSGELYASRGPSSEISHGKGRLVNKVDDYMKETLQVDGFGNPTGKIEWTEKELEAIKQISLSLFRLAQLTKKEGNKKRGYNGPEESDKSEE